MSLKKGNRQEEQGLGNGLAPTEVPDTEVIARPASRRFTKEEKLRILEELDRAPHGEKRAILRREGIYSSTTSKWRKQRARALALTIIALDEGFVIRESGSVKLLAARVGVVTEDGRQVQGLIHHFTDKVDHVIVRQSVVYRRRHQHQPLRLVIAESLFIILILF